MNKPYVKSFDENGVLLNPITKENPYINAYPNRASRRKREPRFRGNQNGSSLTIIGNQAYHRVIQFIPSKIIVGPKFNLMDEKTWATKEKTIYHYIAKTQQP